MNISQTSVHAHPDDALLLDVREPAEWAAGHAPNAVHVPLGALPHRLDDVPRTDEAIPVICRSGVRSAQAVAFLAAHGIAATNVAGGMQAWEEARKAMVADNGQPMVI